MERSISRRLRWLIDILGFSCIGAAIFLQILIFVNIALQSYFYAIEPNPIILSIEVILTIFAFIYFVRIYKWFLDSSAK